MFFENLFYDSTSETTKSFNQLAINTKKKFDVEITKQGVANRYTENALKYVQALIGDAFTHQIHQSIDIGWFKLFKRILIKDSTKFDVSEKLADQLPGFGGNASKAGVCIQYEFDIKSGEINDLTINPANRPDTKDTLDTITKVREGDLIIRDLGYSILSFFIAIHEIEAYFISRLNVNIVVYQKIENKLIELDFGNIYQYMTECKIERLDKQVYIGKEDKFPVRLIIELMPIEIVNKRLEKVNAYNKKKGFQTSDNFKVRSHFNLFITNITEDVLEPAVISKIYKLRWQVELIFKSWKSTFGIDNNNEMKYDRLICLLNVRLLLIIINWNIFMQKRSQLYLKTGKLLSINKCFKTLQDNSKDLTNILMNNCKKLINWVMMIIKLFESNHWIERKKNKIGFVEIMLLNVL